MYQSGEIAAKIFGRPDWRPLAHMDWLTLRFDDTALERRFKTEHLVSALLPVRLFILFGAFLYAAFGLLDALLVPSVMQQLWLIRLVVVCVLLTVLLATYWRGFVRHAQPILCATMIASGGGILAMLMITPAPADHLYYAGVIMVVIFCSSLIRIYHLYAITISVLLLVLYQPIAIHLNPQPWDLIVNNDFFIAMSIMVGAFAGYFQEVYIRGNFLTMELLAAGKADAERLRDQAEAANHAKSAFLAVMSHELRTPLNAIIGFSDVMRQEILGPIGSIRYRAYLDDIYVSGTQLLDLINLVLDLSRAEAGMLELEESEVDLCALADAGARPLQGIAAKQGVHLSMDVPSRRPILRADARLCRQVVANLVSNAIKFTRSGGTIEITILPDARGGVGVRVNDTGIGIAQAGLPHVIKPFGQIDRALSREFGGSGLGLPLVAKIAELHGGDLRIESAVGVGTRVEVWFPPSRVIRHVEGEAARLTF